MLDRETVEEICGPIKPLRSGSELRWVACEACGGSGEIIRREPAAHDPFDEYADLCGPCEGTGRDCVEVSPIECGDLDE